MYKTEAFLPQSIPALDNSLLLELQERLTETRSNTVLRDMPYGQFAAEYLKIRDNKMRIVPFVFNRVQRHFDANRTGKDVILKARKFGISTFIQGLMFYRNVSETSAAVTIADIGLNTDKLRSIYRYFYDGWAGREPRPYRKRDSALLVNYPELNSEAASFTAGSETGGRTGTHSFLHVSEFAFWQNAEIVFPSLSAAMTPDAEQYIESTPNGAQGMFYELCMQADDGNSAWALHFYPWWWGEEYTVELEDGEVITPTEEELEVVKVAAAGGFTLTSEQLKWRRNKIAEPGMALLFPQEYPEDLQGCFLTSGLSIFGNVEGCLRDTTQDKPDDTHRYVGGIDWGQTEDYTVLSIVDATAGEEVYLNRWRRMSPETVLDHIIEASMRWQVEKLRPELNSIGADNVHYLRRRIALKDGADISVGGFFTTNERKRNMVDAMGRAMRNGKLALLRSRDEKGQDYATSELRTFVQTQMPNGDYKYDHISGAKSDTVIARMAAWDAACNLIR